jgi:hypothetical protein
MITWFAVIMDYGSVRTEQFGPLGGFACTLSIFRKSPIFLSDKITGTYIRQAKALHYRNQILSSNNK